MTSRELVRLIEARAMELIKETGGVRHDPFASGKYAGLCMAIAIIEEADEKNINQDFLAELNETGGF
jgi:hypothetical protein